MIQAAIFDFDGTLIDASEAICLSFNAVLSRNGLEPLGTDTVREMIGRPLWDMFGEVLDHPSADFVETCVAQYRAEFMPRSLPLSKPMPGLAVMLKQLAGSVLCGIATSRTVHGACHILEGFGLDQHFDTIVGIDSVTHSKPHPEPVLTALRNLNISPRQAVMVGDTMDDISAGRTAGTMTVGMARDTKRIEELWAAGADHVIQSLEELPAIMGPISNV